MKKWFLITLCLEICRTSWASTPTVCNDLLSDIPKKFSSSTNDGTVAFIGYLSDLLTNHIIGEKELTRFLYDLKQGKLSNPISEEDAQVNASLYIHREGLQEYIKSRKIDKTEILKWVQSQVKEKNKIKEEQEQVKEETQDSSQKMEFNQVEPGEIKVNLFQEIIAIFPRPFEMMSTLVTQKQWTMIMGQNPSYFNEGPNAIVINLDGQQLKMRPNNPVENVSWNDIQQFIKRLNRLSKDDDPLLYQLIWDHEVGDRYRLPTEAEWEYVIRDRGRANGKYHFGDKKAALGNYAWYAANSGGAFKTNSNFATQINPNSGGGTHPVAQLKPLIVDGKEFYDMHGNVKEWVSDRWIRSNTGGLRPYPTNFMNRKEGTYEARIKNPQGPDSKDGVDSERVIRGGSWEDGPESLESRHRGAEFNGSTTVEEKYNDLGFRLVRERK